MAEERVQRKLTTILAADVEGYTRLMRADEEATLGTLTQYREITDNLIARRNGRVFSTAGDSVVAEFGSAVEAVRCAVEIQEELRVRNAEQSDDRRMRFRIGINIGDVMVRDGDLFGDGVNVAARIEGLCAPGEVYVSGSVHGQVEGKLSLGFEDKGEQAVKNIAKPVRVYRVRTSSEENKDQDATGDPLPLPDKPSIAVLAFENRSNDPEQEYFSDGITEDIITELSKISGLFVIAQNSSFVYKGKPVSVKQVGQELGVRYVLEGSVRKAGNRLRITAQLIDSGTDNHLWAERYDRDLEDVFALQDEITGKIVAALEVRLTAGEQEQVERRYTDNLEAYDYFLRGRTYQARSTKETTAQAREMFERAIELDPGFAGAYALLSYTHWRDWRNRWSDDPQALDRALEAATKAVALDDSLPLAHIYLAWVNFWRKQSEEAIAQGERAISLDPNFAEGYARLGEILNFAGRPAEGIDLIQKAMRLDPHYPYNCLIFLGFAYYAMGMYEEAISSLNRAVTRSPDNTHGNLLLAINHIELGQKEEAQARVAEVLRISPRASIASERERVPYTDQALLERHLEGLRKAGLPE